MSQFELTLELAGLTESLRLEQPERLATSYTYLPLAVHTECLPQSVTDFIFVENLKDVVIDTVQEAGEWVGFTVTISSGDRQILISRDPTPSSDDSPSDDLLLVNGKPRPFGRLSVDDMNRIILACVSTDPIGLGVNLSDKNLTNDLMLENLTQQLALSSPYVTEDHLYASHGGEITFRVERFGLSGHSSEITDETKITYPTDNPNRSIQCAVDLSHGVDLSFATIEDGKNPFKPDAASIERLREHIKAISSALTKDVEDATVFVEPLQLEETSEDRITSLVKKNKLGAGPEIDVSDEHGFDTPDTSA